MKWKTALSLALKKAPRTSDEFEKLPKHVAIIMDGNGRWAKKHKLNVSKGHRQGTETLREIIRHTDDLGIGALSLYAFSTENWNRSEEEVAALMQLMLEFFDSEIDELDAKNVRILILGDKGALPEKQRETLIEAENRTRKNTGLRLNIALNYGGREDLVYAARSLAAKAAAGDLKPEDITQEVMEAELRSAGLGDVDLLIRTSGEERVSNFLPWQLAYAEMVFERTLWPDYDRETYLKDLREYAARSRRYGGVDKVEDEEKAGVSA